MKKWTVMVYLGADNDLSVEFLWDLKEMQEFYEGDKEGDKSANEVTVVAQYDPGQGIPTQRYVINRGSAQARADARERKPPDSQDGWLILDDDEILSGDPDLKKIVSGFRPIGKEQQERFNEYYNTLEGQTDPLNKNTGDPMTLLQFIFWGIKYFEAEYYMVVLAGHGSGAVEDFLLKDETARDSLTLHELRDVFQLVEIALGTITRGRLSQALEKESEEKKREELGKKLEQLEVDGGRRLDILGMDSCLMSMAEVYYQLVGSVNYLVGAEGFEPSGGWPYQRILKSLPTQTTPQGVAEKIVDDYVLYYFDYALAGLSVDLSACEIGAGAKSLATEIEILALKLEARLENRAGLSMVMSARQKAQPYKFDQYVDLFDFCHQLTIDRRCSDDDGLKSCCEAVKTNIGTIVKNSSFVGPDYQDSHGLSVYFPWSSVPEKFSKGYEQLQFTRDTNGEWGRFVGKFTEKMRALQLAAPDEATLPAGKTLYSARTLYSGRIGLYSGRIGLGSGEPLYTAYGRVPSIVWKPKGTTTDAINVHVEQLRAAPIVDGDDEGGPLENVRIPLESTKAGSKKREEVIRDNLGIV